MPAWAWVSIGAIAAVIVVNVIGWQYKSTSEGSFTIINSIFSGLAFVGLIIAIFMQREELELQRQELTATRLEFTQQNDILKHQRFETTYFNLLKNFSACQDEYESKDYDSIWSHLGRALFDQNPEKQSSYVTDSELNTVWLRSKQKYEQGYFNGQTKSFLTVYFWNFFNVLKFVDRSVSIDSNEKKGFYAEILFAQITNVELALIAHHLLLSEQDNQVIVLAKEYKILKRFDDKYYLYEYLTRLFKREGYDLW